MNEHALHELLAVLSDAAGLTQPTDFSHAILNCHGQVMDYAQYWQCSTCMAKQFKPPGQNGASNYSTYRAPSGAAMNFVTQKLGTPSITGYQPPVAQIMPMLNEETIRKALGLGEEEMQKLLEMVTRPEPRTAIEHVDQDLRKYTELA